LEVFLNDKPKKYKCNPYPIIWDYILFQEILK
jgi:hypothetical protein